MSDDPNYRNLNNWHWSESDLLPFVQATLSELLCGVACESPKVTLSSATSDGEAYSNTRKGKRILGYDLVASARAEVSLPDGSTVSGKISVAHIGEDADPSEADVSFGIERGAGGGDAAEDARLAARVAVVSWVRARLVEFVKRLEAHASEGGSSGAGAKAPAEGTATKGASSSSSSSSSSSASSSASSSKAASKPTAKSGNSSWDFDIAEEFECRPEDIFDSLMNPQRVMAWSQSPAQIEPKEGGSFTLFGGSIHGKFTRIEPGRAIEQDWRFRSWPEGHFSKVSIVLESDKHGHARLKLHQSNLPSESEAETTREGWSHNIFKRVRSVFGFGGGGVMMGVL